MQNFLFILLPRFSLVSLSCAIDALRGANQILGQDAYAWELASVDGGKVYSSSMIPLETMALSDCSDPDAIIISGGDSSHTFQSKTLDTWMHEQAKAGKRIGSVSDGSFVVGGAGLFDECPSTIHWKCYDAYRERFPKLDIRFSMLEISAKRFSCAGGTASLDLMLHFISEHHGSDITSLIAQNYFHDTIRDSSREQHITNAFRIASTKPQIAEAILLMEGNLEQPLKIAKIAERLSLSRRQLDRLFAQEMSQSPQEFYLQLRLVRASGLLLQTALSSSEIAVGCGFQSASHLAKHFKKRFGSTPGVYRRESSRVRTLNFALDRS